MHFTGTFKSLNRGLNEVCDTPVLIQAISGLKLCTHKMLALFLSYLKLSSMLIPLVLEPV